ncbi:low affinity iron permease family protein [Benzoatithermus flavus]|uniref:Low affinity iron permease family protein n=1 Tax=Benzoatithermus flavus TaxID=3108223 RepID=A0ABU8XU86_9PROT
MLRPEPAAMKLPARHVRFSEARPFLQPKEKVVGTPNELFSRIANWISRQAGRSYTFILAIAVVVVWAATGPLFGFSDTWQLIINTGTTIVTFLMVFLIQNTQNRDTQAIQLKLDELIRVHREARNRLLTLEDLTDAELDQVKERFARLARRHPQAAPHLHDARENLEEVEEYFEQAQAQMR